MKNYPNLFNRLVNQPLLATPQKAQIVLAVLCEHSNINANITLADGGSFDTKELASQSMESFGKSVEPKIYQEVDGIAIIPVSGSLVNKNGLHPYSGMTGYDGISAKLWTAIADPEIEGILLDIESNGGEVSGCFDLADQIFEAKATKPIWAGLTDRAYSAAFALASQCDRICVPKTGGVGSVGVVTMHADFSEKLSNDGIKVTLIHAGSHKVDGNPYEPLPKEVRGDLQAWIDDTYEIFVDTVARGRGMTVEAVKATEARIYNGQSGVDIGFADEVIAGNRMHRSFREFLSSRSNGLTIGAQAHSQSSEEAIIMDKEQEAAEAEAAKEVNVSQISESAAMAERERVSGILGCPEADGRTKLANHLALETDLSVEVAIAMLAKAAKEASSSGLDGRMSGEENPDIGADDDGDERSGDQEVADRMVANFNQATGRKTG